MPVAQVADWPAVPAGLARCAIAKAGAVLNDRRARQRAARRRHPQSGDERVEREIHPRRNHPQAADEVEPGDGEQQSWRKRARPRRPRARADSRRWCRNTRLPDLLRRAHLSRALPPGLPLRQRAQGRRSAALRLLAGGCACVASGHAAAAIVINSRRRISVPKLRRQHCKQLARCTANNSDGQRQDLFGLRRRQH